MLEDLVRPGALELAREAVRRGIDIEGMCRQPTYNQGCYGCGKHQGWGCVCRGEEKREAWERREVKMATPWFAGKWDSANLQTVSANPSHQKIAKPPQLQTAARVADPSVLREQIAGNVTGGEDVHHRHGGGIRVSFLSAGTGSA